VLQLFGYIGCDLNDFRASRSNNINSRLVTINCYLILQPNLCCSEHVAKSSRCIGEPYVLIPCFAGYMDRHMDV
jgi:hypothetical protein